MGIKIVAQFFSDITNKCNCIKIKHEDEYLPIKIVPYSKIFKFDRRKCLEFCSFIYNQNNKNFQICWLKEKLNYFNKFFTRIFYYFKCNT